MQLDKENRKSSVTDELSVTGKIRHQTDDVMRSEMVKDG